MAVKRKIIVFKRKLMSLSEKLIFWAEYNDFKRNLEVLREKSLNLSENSWFSKQKPEF